MERRQFLKLAGLAGIGIAMPSVTHRASAQAGVDDAPYAGPYYLVFNASGGWDTTYLMDPKGVNGINRLYTEGGIPTAGNLTFAPNAANITAGMSNEDFFAKYYPELLVINGIDISVNNHSPCSRYVATGKLDSLAFPTFAALVAACKGPMQPLSFLTFGNYSATGNLVSQARIPYLNRLADLAEMDDTNFGPFQNDYATQQIEAALAARRMERAASPQLPRVERAQSMLYTAQLSASSLKRIQQYIPASTPDGRLERQVEIAMASFAAGVSVSANLSIGQFDSHASNDPDQMNLIPEFLAGIDYAMERAAALGIRDELVVIIQSEMGRTPYYNGDDGKDHWSIGSVMVMGKGVVGNRVVGATDDGQMPYTVNPATVALDDAGIRMRPEHFHTALRELAGIGGHEYSLAFDLAVPDAERLVGLWG